MARGSALARDGVSREVPCSALKGETVPDTPELVGPCHAHPFAVREGLSRLLLFPLLIAVHLVVKEVLRAHTQQSLSSPGLGGNGRAKKLELWGAPGPQEKATLRRI